MELTFTGREFSKDDLSEHPIKKGEYEKCTFRNCDLSNSDISEYLFEHCAFIGCNLSLIKLNRTTFRDVNFKDCKMLGLHFENCNKFALSFSFDHCVLNHSSLYQMKLKNTCFKHTLLHEVDLTECDLAGAVFDTCDFSGATFDHTILEKADLRTAYNYSIDPERNRIKKAKFSLPEVVGLLNKYDIVIEGI